MKAVLEALTRKDAHIANSESRNLDSFEHRTTLKQGIAAIKAFIIFMEN